MTVRDKKKLVRCEEKIVDGMRAFYEVGEALETIRDEDLYQRYAVTFAEYCKTRWEMSPNRAGQLIGASQAYRHLKNRNNCSYLPQNEGQTRPLLGLSKKDDAGDGRKRVIDLEQIEGVWETAVAKAPRDNDGKPLLTAKHVEGIVARAISSPEEEDESTDEESPTEGAEAAAQVSEDGTNEADNDEPEDAGPDNDDDPTPELSTILWADYVRPAVQKWIDEWEGANGTLAASVVENKAPELRELK
jgi:hypothetical protein